MDQPSVYVCAYYGYVCLSYWLINERNFIARTNLHTSNSNIKSSSTDNWADFGRANAVNDAVASGWKGDFVSGAEGTSMKRRHWIEIQLVNEIMTVGVKITAMAATKATDIFRKTSVRAGMTPTSMSNAQDISSLQSHMDLSVYYEGPAALGSNVHLLYDEPVKTKYIFLEAHLDTANRWGFAEIYVLLGEKGLIYCENSNPLSGITGVNNKASVLQ